MMRSSPGGGFRRWNFFSVLCVGGSTSSIVRRSSSNVWGLAPARLLDRNSRHRLSARRMNSSLESAEPPLDADWPPGLSSSPPPQPASIASAAARATAMDRKAITRRLRPSGVLRRHLDLAGALDVLPPEPGPPQGADHRLDDDQVHQLAVDDLLQRQRPQRSQGLAVQPERIDGEDQADRVEAEPVGRDGHGI